jgi:hypothetical protein
VNAELERIFKELVMAWLRHYTSICLKGLRNNTEKKKSERLAGILAEI